MQKLAVVLGNLGGPESLDEVPSFLFNLFNDYHIIRLRQPLRAILAFFISRTRASKARNIYKAIGGRSPILKETENQRQALLDALCSDKDIRLKYSDIRVFIGMGYARPFIADTTREVFSFNPDRVVLLPLYPQFSTTTTLSFFSEWDKQALNLKWDLKERCVRIHEYCDHPLFIEAHVDLIESAYKEALQFGNPRILFSAHSLPLSIVAAGDPYPHHVERTINACVSQFLERDVETESKDKLDFALCYQSKVGPLKWLEPSLDSEIRRAAKDAIPIVVVPIAFVSEHSETLYELDIEYRELASELSIPFYKRVSALSVHPKFIQALTSLCKE